jgi:hypothetical protein
MQPKRRYLRASRRRREKAGELKSRLLKGDADHDRHDASRH